VIPEVRAVPVSPTAAKPDFQFALPGLSVRYRQPAQIAGLGYPDAIKWQMLADGQRHLNSVPHQISDHESNTNISLVFGWTPHQSIVFAMRQSVNLTPRQ